MLHIFLVILKVIGIILLVIAGLLVLTVVLIAAVPIRYTIRGKREEDLTVKATVSWLLHLFCLDVRTVNDKYRFRFKILGLALYDSDRPKRMKVKKAGKKMKEEAEETAEESADAILDREQDEAELLPPKEREARAEPMPAGEREGKADEAKSREPKKSIFVRIKDFFCRIKYTVKVICGKIRSGYQKIKEFIEFIQAESTKRAWKMLKEQGIVMLKQIRPRKIRGHVAFGFDDPALTGYVLGLCSMAYPWYGKQLQLEPDFEQVVLEGELFVSGRIYAGVILIALLKLYRDDDVRKIFNIIR